MKYTQEYTSATLFSKRDVQDAEDCIELGLSLCSVEISEPVLVSAGNSSEQKPHFEPRPFCGF